VAVAADNATVAIGGNSREVVLLDLRQPDAAPIVLGTHRTYVHCLAFSPDAGMLLSGSEDGGVKLWDVSAHELVKTLRRHTGAVAAASFSPHSGLAATASWDGSLKLWDVASDAVVLQQGHPQSIYALAFAASGHSILTAGGGGMVREWNLNAPSEPIQLVGHQGMIRGLCFLSDGQQLVSAGVDGTVRLWDLAAQHQLESRQVGTADPSPWMQSHPEWIAGGGAERVMAVCSTPDNHIVAGDYGGRVSLFDQATTDQPRPFEEAEGPIWSLALSPDGKTLAAAGYRSNSVLLWDVATGKKRATLRGHSDRLWAVAFSPDGRLIASSGNDGTVRLWNAADGRLVRAIPTSVGWMYALVFSPDGRTVAVAGDDNRVRTYAVATGDEGESLGQHPATIRALLYLPRGEALAAAGDDGTVKLWDCVTRQERVSLEPPQAVDAAGQAASISFWSLAIAPGGHAIAAGDGQGRITVWSAQRP
jgi:WD40 repeat protein